MTTSPTTGRRRQGFHAATANRDAARIPGPILALPPAAHRAGAPSERANGRLYVSADFALPRDLDPEEQIALARTFAEELTRQERLPYTLAVHAGRDAHGREHNPHAHLMFSERRNDGFERSRAQWFRRTDSGHPKRGGAPKSRTFHGPQWVEEARERWAAMTIAALERAGRSERVDHRRNAKVRLWPLSAVVESRTSY